MMRTTLRRCCLLVGLVVIGCAGETDLMSSIPEDAPDFDILRPTGPCKCTWRGHEFHRNVVTAVSVKRAGQPVREELSGSMVWTCKHKGAGLERDEVAWQNERRSRKPLVIRFPGAWPFEPPKRDITVAWGETSDFFKIRADADTGIYRYYTNLPAPDAPNPGGSQGLTVRAAPKLMPQPGPAVVVDD